jgi:hypothetical protein
VGRSSSVSPLIRSALFASLTEVLHGWTFIEATSRALLLLSAGQACVSRMTCRRLMVPKLQLGTEATDPALNEPPWGPPDASPDHVDVDASLWDEGFATRAMFGESGHYLDTLARSRARSCSAGTLGAIVRARSSSVRASAKRPSPTKARASS